MVAQPGRAAGKNLCVSGSNPFLSTNKMGILAQLVRAGAVWPWVIGSSPVDSPKQIWCL